MQLGADLAFLPNSTFLVTYYDKYASTPGLYYYRVDSATNNVVKTVIDPRLGSGESGTTVLVPSWRYPYVFYGASDGSLMCVSCMNLNCTVRTRYCFLSSSCFALLGGLLFIYLCYC